MIARITICTLRLLSSLDFRIKSSNNKGTEIPNSLIPKYLPNTIFHTVFLVSDPSCHKESLILTNSKYLPLVHRLQLFPNTIIGHVHITNTKSKTPIAINVCLTPVSNQ